MAGAIKKAFCHAAKWSGGFLLARRITRGGLRILAYHGFVLDDEGNFLPGVFMDAVEFRWRMNYLVRHGYPVLSLPDALRDLYQHNLPTGATVVTFDDGFYSTWNVAVPILCEARLPATIYITTYFCINPRPVFRLAIRYMMWKTKRRELDLRGLGLDDEVVVSLGDVGQREQVARRIFQFAERNLNGQKRTELITELGHRLDVDYDSIREKRFLSLMTKEEIQAAVQTGVDIQLHTHRHNLPEDIAGVGKELAENHAILDPLLREVPEHFCYPSGIRNENHDEPLRAAGVASAVTCEPGFNYVDTNPLVLTRFLDSALISRIEFEAEQSGFFELLRQVRSSFRRFVFKSAERRPVPGTSVEV